MNLIEKQEFRRKIQAAVDEEVEDLLKIRPELSREQAIKRTLKWFKESVGKAEDSDKGYTIGVDYLKELLKAER